LIANCSDAVAGCRMSKRTYLDSGVLLAAFAAKDTIGLRALEILDDADRTFISSDAVRLEVMPKAIYEKRQDEIDFYEAIFSQTEELKWRIDTLCHAYDLAQKHGIAAMDAIHVAIALDADVDEFITAEKPTKPMFRVADLNVNTIRPEAAP
jgi:predicted nucleic acid-binding protein